TEAKYIDPATGREGISVLSFKSALVAAAQYAEGKVQKFLKGCFFIQPDFFVESTPCVFIEGKSRMLEDQVRVGMGKADMRYRPAYFPWSVTLHIEYDAALVTPQQIITLLNRAGFSGGVGEWRQSSPV